MAQERESEINTKKINECLDALLDFSEPIIAKIPDVTCESSPMIPVTM